MPITHDSYLIASHKELHGVYDASAKKKAVAKEHALRLAQRTGNVIVIVRVVEIVTPQQAVEQSVERTPSLKGSWRNAKGVLSVNREGE